MTIDIKIATVADSIAGITISGVTVKDVDAIPESAKRLTPVFFPRPNDFITDIEFTRESQGGAGSALMNLSYTLNYVYCHADINSGAGSVMGVYAGLIANIALILEAILQNDNIAGAVDMQLLGVSNVGPVNDPAGNAYHGVEIALRVTEFAQ